MNIISTNCCGGRIYQYTHTQFNNPFIWMVCPYASLYNVMLHFYDINWNAITMKESHLRANTYILVIDKLVEIHYVHYFFNPVASHPEINRNNSSNEVEWSGQVEYCRIWEYIVQKYKERLNRMISLGESPSFLLRDENYGNSHSNVTMYDLANLDCPYKRYIITTDKRITRNDDLVRTNVVDTILMPLPTVKQYYYDIKSFFALNTIP